MQKLLAIYLHWVQFWRLPESSASQRVQCSAYQRRVTCVRRCWWFTSPLLVLSLQPAIVVTGFLFLVFASFMFLDESSD